jgi:hypothetical protein
MSACAETIGPGGLCLTTVYVDGADGQRGWHFADEGGRGYLVGDSDRNGMDDNADAAPRISHTGQKCQTPAERAQGSQTVSTMTTINR